MLFSYFKGGRIIWRYSVFTNFLGGDTVIWIKNRRYSVFQSPNGDGKVQNLIWNTVVTVFVQKFDYDITIIFEKINGNTLIQNLVRTPLSNDGNPIFENFKNGMAWKIIGVGETKREEIFRKKVGKPNFSSWA